MTIIITNIITEPNNEKYLRLKLTNKLIQTYILPLQGG